MTRTILYVGFDFETLQSIITDGAPEVRPNIYATTAVTEAIERLVKEQFDYLLIGRGLQAEDIEVLLRIADSEVSTVTLCWRDEFGQLDDAHTELIDGTFDPEGERTFDGPSPFDESTHTAGHESERENGDGGDESTSNRIACVHRDGTYLWVNDSMAASIEGADSEIEGNSIAEAPPKGFFDTLPKLWGQTVNTGSEQRRVVTDEGSRRVVSVYPLDGDRFMLLEESQDTEFTFDGQYLDRLNDLFFILDFGGTLVYWNDVVTETTGYDDVELADLNAFELFEGGDHERAVTAIESVRASGETSVELQLTTKGGETIPYQFSASLVRDDDGTPQYVCGIGRDISNRVEMQAEIESAIEELKQSNDELEHFAYMASHDLKEPLRTIRSFLEILETRYGDELGEDGHEFIEFATNGALRMSSMIDDLLEYSRISGNVSFESVDTNDVFEEVYKNLQLRIEESNAKVSSDPLPKVSADKNLLVQLFQNLVDNAIKHADEDPRIHLSADETGDMVRFMVTDENDGMTDAETEDIFELFSTGHDETGSGIGLATCKKIVESHGGSIWVESEKGTGSTFYFTLPRTPGVAEEMNTVTTVHSGMTPYYQ